MSFAEHNVNMEHITFFNMKDELGKMMEKISACGASIPESIGADVNLSKNISLSNFELASMEFRVGTMMKKCDAIASDIRDVQRGSGPYLYDMEDCNDMREFFAIVKSKPLEANDKDIPIEDFYELRGRLLCLHRFCKELKKKRQAKNMFM